MSLFEYQGIVTYLQLVTCVIVWISRGCDILAVSNLCHCLNIKGLWHTDGWLPVSWFEYKGIVTYWQLVTCVIVWISRDCDILAVGYLCHCLNIKGLWHTGSWLPVSLFEYQGIVTYWQLVTCVIVWISRDCDILAGITPGIPDPVSPKIRKKKFKK